MLQFRVSLGICALACLVGAQTFSSPPFRLHQTSPQLSIVGSTPHLADYNHDGYQDLFLTHLFLPLLHGYAQAFEGGPEAFQPAPRLPALPVTQSLPTKIACSPPYLFIADSNSSVWVSQHIKNLTFSVPTRAVLGLPRQSVFDVVQCTFLDTIVYKGKKVLLVSQSYSGQLGMYSEVGLYAFPGYRQLVRATFGSVHAGTCGEFDGQPGDELVCLAGTPQGLAIPPTKILTCWQPTGKLFQHKTPLDPARNIAYYNAAYVSGEYGQKHVVLKYDIDWQSRTISQRAIYTFPEPVNEILLFDEIYVCSRTKLYDLNRNIVFNLSNSPLLTGSRFAVSDLTHNSRKDFIQTVAENQKLRFKVYHSTRSFRWGWQSLPGTGNSTLRLSCTGKAVRGNKTFQLHSPLPFTGWNFFFTQKPALFGLHVLPRSVFLGHTVPLPVPEYTYPFSSRPFYFQSWDGTGRCTLVLEVLIKP